MFSAFQRLVNNRLVLSRFFIFIGGFTLFIMGVLNEVKGIVHNDPFWIRCVVSGEILTCFLLSFLKPLKKYHNEILYIVLYLGSSWTIYMLYANSFFSRYTTVAYVLTFVSLFFYEDLKPFVYYLLFLVIGTFTAFWFTPVRNEEAYSFVYFYPFVASAILYGNYYLLNSKEKIAESAELFESLVNSTMEAYIMVDRNYKIVQLNDKAREGFKRFTTNEVYIGKSILDFALNSKEEAADRVDKAFLGRSDLYEFEVPFLEGIRYWQTRYLPVEIMGVIRYVAMSSIDVTDMVLVQKEILEAKEKAEAANVAKTEFLSVMSHEIRTPMNAVIGMTHLLKDSNPTPEQAEHIDTLQFSAQNLLVIINDILDYNKIEAGRIEFEYRPLSIKEEVNRVMSSFKMKAHDKRIELSIEILKDVPEYISADSTRLAQVLVNLVGNAVKFTKQGFVKVRVTVKNKTKKTVSLKFEVIDTGIGISPENQSKIFESFSQETTSTTRKFGGTGLGLAITKKLLELQGSAIHVTSEKGKGSNFWFEQEFEITEKKKKSKEQYVADVQISLKEKNILLVEDNVVNQMVAKQFLDKWKVSTDIASNGKEAIEKVEEKDYDLILMDLQMPVMDGFDATEKIRALNDKKKREVPIIALTASALLEVQQQVKEASMNSIVTKPFNPDDLYAKIAAELV